MNWRKPIKTAGGLIAAFLLAFALPSAAADERLAGRLLVAAPDMVDPNFERTVIFLVHHDEQGSFGVVVNVPLGEVPLMEFLTRINPSGRQPSSPEDDRPPTAPPAEPTMLLIHYGGPVEPRSLGLLHSADVMLADSLQVGPESAFTRNPEILLSLAEGKGPEKSVLTLGYAGWAPGQLDHELKRGSWYVITWNAELVFDEDYKTMWDRAVALGGPEL